MCLSVHAWCLSPCLPLCCAPACFPAACLPASLPVSVCVFCIQVIKGPVTKYFPVNARRIGFSVGAELHPVDKFVREQLDDAVPVVFVVGAFAHGAIDTSYVDEEIAVSQYSLSAAYALARITNAMEMKWGIV